MSEHDTRRQILGNLERKIRGERCSDCGHVVHRSDPYYGTPCGTFCSDCMEERHAKECGVCASEFDLNDPFEEDGKNDEVDNVNNPGTGPSQ